MASLALGIVGMACFVLYAVPCVLAIVFGVIGTNQVKRGDGAESGTGLGIAGIVLGITGLCLLVFVLAVFAGSWDITRMG